MNFWIFLGLLNLIRLTVQDLRNNRNVDDRYNFFMMGATIMLLEEFRRPWYFTISAILIITLLVIILNKRKVLGQADLSTMIWLFVGLAIIKIPSLVFFFIILIILIILSSLIYKYIFKSKTHFPAYPSFLLAYLMTVLFSLLA